MAELTWGRNLGGPTAWAWSEMQLAAAWS